MCIRDRVAAWTVVGTLYYLAFVGLVARFYGGWFAFAYIIYPFLEQSVMLSGINWVRRRATHAQESADDDVPVPVGAWCARAPLTALRRARAAGVARVPRPG